MKVQWILGLVLAGAAASASPEQGLNPEQRRLLAELVTDPRFNQDKFIKGLQPAADLKLAMDSRGLIDEVNYIYDWSLSAKGFWTAKQSGDIIYGLISSPKYRQEAFLSGVEKGAPLLRELRERRCIEPFNRRYGTALPESGGVTPEAAEVFLYDVMGREEAQLDDICPTRPTAPSSPTAAPATDAGSEGASGPVPALPASVPVETRGGPLLWFSGGAAAVLLGLLIVKVSRDLRRR